MVNMAHNGDNRCSRFGSAFLTSQCLFESFLDLFGALQNDSMTHFFYNQGGRILI